jgi:membrane protein
MVFTVICRYAPSRDEPQWRWITWGSAVAALLWLGVSALFSYYAANFGTFDQTYGSLGAVIGFMLWMWLSVIVVLLGGKLNAEIEHQTVGRPEALGAAGGPRPDRRRGAR